MDPQHRHFLECCWEALENAGHARRRFAGPIGVFAGCGMGSYFMFNVLHQPGARRLGRALPAPPHRQRQGLPGDAGRPTMLDLRGPERQRADGLLDVAGRDPPGLPEPAHRRVRHGARRRRRRSSCRTARGYLYAEGEILSPDGHCRRLRPSRPGHGLRQRRRRRRAAPPRGRARRTATTIYAVIKGSAINNDGSGKVGYLAPSVDGQAAAIAEALAVAGVDPGHDRLRRSPRHRHRRRRSDRDRGADPGLPRRRPRRTGFCAIGSVKTNIGHLDTAAGVASLIKVALALEHAKLPPSLNFEAPNPEIDFEAQPLRRQRPAVRLAARAGRDAPGSARSASAARTPTSSSRRRRSRPASRPSRRCTAAPLSARNDEALDATPRRSPTISRPSEIDLADVAYTLQVGRPNDRRRVVVARRPRTLRAARGRDPRRVFTHRVPDASPRSSSCSPARRASTRAWRCELYDSEPVFREHLDRGLELLEEENRTVLPPGRRPTSPVPTPRVRSPPPTKR